ncbi:MAG: hypothetical protein PHS74_00435 [Lachnospiraceae bacterium]|nr:hypothetical protein [Lachnospiraceae bacterium]
MIKKILLYLESKLKFKEFTSDEVELESVTITSDEMYDFLLTIQGVTNEMATEIVEGLQSMGGC